MAMTSPRLLFLPPALVLAGSAALVVGLLHCTDGTTPNCTAADAGCAPGVDAGVDATVSDGGGSDGGEAGDAPAG